MLGLKRSSSPSFRRSKRIVGLAKLAGALDDRLEHRFDVGRRGGDDLEDVAAAGLVGQGLGEIAGLGLHLLEQPHIRIAITAWSANTSMA